MGNGYVTKWSGKEVRIVGVGDANDNKGGGGSVWKSNISARRRGKRRLESELEIWIIMGEEKYRIGGVGM